MLSVACIPPELDHTPSSAGVGGTSTASGSTSGSGAGGSGGGDGGSAGHGGDDCAGGASGNPSCACLASTCGVEPGESCCSDALVPGGSFNRSNDVAYPAVVDSFRLDTYEVTVGRFRAFLAAYPGSKPAVGAGAHPLIEDSGWKQGWDAALPGSAAELRVALGCNAIFQAWTAGPGPNERLPINCVTWFEAFAFCAWDGGRLPTEAEWNLAAAGGSEQRTYPWDPAVEPGISNAQAGYDCLADGSASDACAFADLLAVGTRPQGSARHGHQDVAGNVAEWTLDSYAPYAPTCSNCATLVETGSRTIRGGDYQDDADRCTTVARPGKVQGERGGGVGMRCARDR